MKMAVRKDKEKSRLLDRSESTKLQPKNAAFRQEALVRIEKVRKLEANKKKQSNANLAVKK